MIGDGAALLARAEELLRSATPKEGYVALVAPLLLVSGRREIEILNVCTGRASFEKVGERSVLFTGQAKTKSSEGAAYVIPLLVETGASSDQGWSALIRDHARQRGLPLVLPPAERDEFKDVKCGTKGWREFEKACEEYWANCQKE